MIKKLTITVAAITTLTVFPTTAYSSDCTDNCNPPTSSYYCYVPPSVDIKPLLKENLELSAWVTKLLFTVQKKNIKIHELRLEIRRLKRQSHG